MMKGKIFAIALVVMMVVGALVLASCSACPGGGSSGGAENCNITIRTTSGNPIYQCTNNCISNQGTYVKANTYSFDSSKTCNCA